MKRICLSLLLMTFLFFPLEHLVASAGKSGRITGITYNQDGAILAGVTLTLSSPLLRNPLKLASAKDGSFTFDKLSPGNYSLLVEQPGLKTIDKRGIMVSAGKTVSLYLVMELPTGEETVVVVASRPIIDTTNMTQGGSYSGNLAGNVPTGRSYQTGSTFLPGVVSEKEMNTEAYDHIEDNSFLASKQNPLSTFSIDVDTASYSNTRRFLQSGQKPPKDAVRIEELINYFSYQYETLKKNEPFSVNVEVASAPWKPSHRLVRIGLQGKKMLAEERPISNLVFLVDVSGSMQAVNKLPLVKSSLRLLIEQLEEKDRVAIVVYASASGVVLPSTAADVNGKKQILRALDRLEAGGSTNGGAGIELAYQIAQQNYLPEGINRVILATDGDFNVGQTSEGQLQRLIKKKAKSGVFLSVLGFGMGNYKDTNAELLSNKGNGNYAYIDTIQEARKSLVEELSGTLITIAKDVKIQVEFNPKQVEGYRLIGYENRLLKSEDFKDDTKDAGEIGAGHTVTALYEVVPAGEWVDSPPLDPLTYQQDRTLSKQASTGELLTLKLRYKEATGKKSKELSFAVKDTGKSWKKASKDFQFASAVAAFGMLLRDSPHKGKASFKLVSTLAKNGLGDDQFGYRKEFLELIKLAKKLRS